MGANPTNGNTRTPPSHRRPPEKGRGKRGTRTTPRTPQHPNQEEWGAAETRAQHTRPHSTPHPRKAGYKRGARTHTHTHAPTPLPGVSGRSSNPGPYAPPRTAPLTRRCRRPRRTGTQAYTHPNTSHRRGAAQPKPGPQHTRPHRTPELKTAASRRSAHTATHVPKP